MTARRHSGSRGEGGGHEPSVRTRRDLRAAVRAGHPWIWRDALFAHEHAPGTLVRVTDAEGRFVARGFVDGGAIGVRVLSARDEPWSDAMLASRLRDALSLRARVIPPETSAYRWVHGEGDRLPGIVVDRYDRFAVVQVDGEGALALVDATVRALAASAPDLAGIVVREGRRDDKRVRVAYGAAPDALVEVREHGMRLAADLVHGQKTGLFLDHRESRRRVRALAHGARVLNLYGYTGGFSVAAGLGGAIAVDTVDVAPAALALAERAFRDNGLDAVAHRTHARDVPELLAEARARGDRWDIVIADPPSFAPSEAALQRAIKSYRALHRACLELVAPGGLYLAASCSSHVDRATFDRTLREAAEKVGRAVQVLERWGAPPDHPRLVAFPEGDYLKCVLARAL